MSDDLVSTILFSCLPGREGLKMLKMLGGRELRNICMLLLVLLSERACMDSC